MRKGEKNMITPTNLDFPSKKTFEPLDKPQKKSHSSSSSDPSGNFDETQWLFPFPMLELLPDQTVKYVCRQITKKAIKLGLKRNETNVFSDIRFQNILRPFRYLNDFLNNTPRRDLALSFVHLMLYDPFTITDITLPYDHIKRIDDKNFKSFVRRIANLLIKCELLARETLKGGKYDIPKRIGFMTTILYFSPVLIDKTKLMDDETVKYIIEQKRIDAELGKARKSDIEETSAQDKETKYFETQFQRDIEIAMEFQHKLKQLETKLAIKNEYLEKSNSEIQKERLRVSIADLKEQIKIIESKQSTLS